MKRKWKKALGMMLCLAMLFSLAACSPSAPSESNEDALYKAGTYKATVAGHNGELTVEVTFDDTAIKSIAVLDHKESAGISDVPLERIPQEIVEQQSLAVDTVAGATVTSAALLAAVEDCVKQAGGDVEALKAKAAENNTGKTDQELTTDVVVVGGGGAGLAAAASAYEQGAQVIVLEKLATVGGSTALSGGGISATDTKFQRELGIQDSKESWMTLWQERQGASNIPGLYPNYEWVDTFMDEAVVTTEWLVDYVGHEYATVTGFGLDPVERIHFAYSDATTKGGTTLIQNMEKFLKEQGVEILTETPATELLVNSDGVVVGVVAEGKTGKITIHAKKVILATGGYAKNEALLEKYIPEAAGTAAMSIAGAGSTGDGILMAEKVGAVMYEEPWVIGVGNATKIPGTGSLNMDWTRLYVNEKGERFTNEQIHYAIATNKLLAEKATWLIIDSTEANANLTATLEAAAPSEEFVKADTFEGLAEAMGVPKDAFAETMTAFNAGAKSGKDAQGKAPEYLVAVESAPYYAIKFYPLTMGTFAGVKTDESFQVLKADGSVIENLYATGECANKILYNQVYMSGSAVQFALTSGRLAGAHAAQTLE